MKFRSGLLVACMIVVPMLAMFSHHVPDGLVAAASRLVYDPLVSTLSSKLSAVLKPTAAGDNGASPAAAFPTAEATPGATEGPAGRPAAAQLAAMGTPASAIRPESSGPPAGQAGRLAAAAKPPAPANGTDAGNAGSAAAARLAALGALSIDCRPMPGVTGRHRASCRMPVDAEGQLHRVFQATGPDRAAAEQNLLEDVLATWRHAPR